jgi:hypothetical protein
MIKSDIVFLVVFIGTSMLPTVSTATVKSAKPTKILEAPQTATHMTASNSDEMEQPSNFPETRLGIRLGVDAESELDVFSYEAYTSIDWGWNWSLNEHLRLNLRLEAAIGELSGESENALYGRIAPVAELQFDDCPLHLVFSSGPSLYSRDTFGHYDIGGHFQFTSSAGFCWNLNRAWKVEYRFQHSSNADTATPNPGLDMHTISLAHHF